MILIGVACALILAYAEKRSARSILKTFTVNRVFDFGTLMGLSGVAWTVALGEYMHYSLTLFLGGLIAFAMAVGGHRKMLPKNTKSAHAEQPPPNPVRTPRNYFYGGVSFVVGLFALFTAYSLLPNITNIEGAFTFSLLITLVVIFLLRVIPLVRVHVAGGIGIAMLISMNVYPALLAEHQFLGMTFQLNEAVAIMVTAMLIIFSIAVIYGFLKWLNESANELSKGLRSFPVLASVGLVAMVWAIRLVMMENWLP